MVIKHDTNYISAVQFELMDRGYGEKSVHSIHFERYYSQEEKAENAARHSALSHEEWGKFCDEIAKSFANRMPDILSKFIDKYDIHQVSPETSTMEHFRSDWDLFYNPHYCQGYDKQTYFDGFTLTFNSRRTVDQNMRMLEDIIPMTENLIYKNIACRVQYDAVIDEKKVAADADKVFENLNGKFIEHCGMVGKIKVVGRTMEGKRYGFFRKNARKKYYPISSAEVLAMSF